MNALRRWAIAALAVVWAIAAAHASPYFSISTLPEWQDALGGGGGGGSIKAVEAAMFQGMMDDLKLEGPGWPDDYKYETTFCTPQLYVMEHKDSQGKSEPGLVMKWGDPDGQNDLGRRYAAAWDYEYALDPDLSKGNGVIEFSIHAPERCWFVSVNLIDWDGDYREWIWHVTDPIPFPGEEGEIPACTWTTVRVNPVTGWSNYAVTAYFTMAALDPQGQPISNGVFELDKIVKIRFDENGRWSEWLQNNDENYQPQGPVAFLWNAWDHVSYDGGPVAEPACLGLVGLSLLAARRRRAEARKN